MDVILNSLEAGTVRLETLLLSRVTDTPLIEKSGDSAFFPSMSHWIRIVSGDIMHEKYPSDCPSLTVADCGPDINRPERDTFILLKNACFTVPRGRNPLRR